VPSGRSIKAFESNNLDDELKRRSKSTAADCRLQRPLFTLASLPEQPAKGEMLMNIQLKTLAMVAVAFALSAASKANAECGNATRLKSSSSVMPQSWQSGSQFNGASLLLVSNHHDDGIVGFWKVAFTAKGNADIPDGAPIDNALIVYHSDGTEIMNSGRPPQDGNFCMGVWVKTGWHRFKVNHFAGGNDTTNAPTGIGNPTGPTHITEKIWLSPDTNSFAGTFVLDATDPAGNPTAHIIGVLTATRITINTNSVF
jgi:hypothetical protein